MSPSILSHLLDPRRTLLLPVALLAMLIPTNAQTPTYSTGGANKLTGNSAILNGNVNAEGVSGVTATFTYINETTTASVTTSPPVTIPATTANTPVAVQISGLSGSTAYDFYITVSVNGTPLTPNGATRSFGTYPQPIFGSSSNAPPNGPTVYPSGTGATVTYPIEPNGEPTFIYFQYGTTTNYGSTTPEVRVGSGSQYITGYGNFGLLQPNTQYHYQMVAVSNQGGIFPSPDQTFTTLNIATSPIMGKATVGGAIPTMTTTEGPASESFTIGEGNIISAPGKAPNTASANPTDLNAYFNLPSPPAVNDNGDVAFGATLTAAAGVAVGTNQPGIWVGNPNPSGISTTPPENPVGTAPGTLSLVAQVGEVAPDITGKYLSLYNPVLNDNGNYAFLALLHNGIGGINGTNDSGVWTSSSGALHLLAQQGSAAPGTLLNGFTHSATFDNLFSVGISDVNTIVASTLGSAAGAAGVTGANNQGIWEGTQAGNLTLSLRTSYHDTASGKTIASLSLFPSSTNAPIQTRNFASNTGDLALGATFTDHTTGIVTVEGGTVAVPYINGAGGAAVPGISGAHFATFGNPIINTSDNFAFQATLANGSGGITGASNSGIWTDISNAGALVAQTGQPAPGTSDKFTQLSDPVMNNNNAVAFRGVITGPGADDLGLWTNASGALALVGIPTGSGGTGVAQAGQPAPGCVNGIFQTFYSWALADNGRMIFSGSLVPEFFQDITYDNNQGVWATDQSGNIQLIVRTGDTLNGETIESIRFVAGVPQVTEQTDDQSRSISQANGNLTYVLTFTDGTEGIYTVTFP